MTMYGPVGIQGPASGPVGGAGKRDIWDEDTPNSPNTRSFPDGTLRALRTGGVASNPADWVILSQKPAAGPKYSGTGLPAGYVMGADGLVYVQDSSTASGLRPATQQEIAILNTPAPRQVAERAPTPPQTFTDRNGDVVGVNPFTGAEVYRIAGAQWADISPDEKERIRQGDLNMARLFQRERDTAQNQFTRDENAIGRAASSAESALSREFQSGESALSRAFSGEEGYQSRVQRAGEFLANYEISRAQEARAAQESKLRAASTFTSLSASPDLTGYQRFLAAGGGSAANALSSGATSLTREGQLGAARALQTAEAPIVVPAAYSFTPERNQFATPAARPAAPATGAEMFTGGGVSQSEFDRMLAQVPTASAPPAAAAAPPPSVPTGPAPPPGVAGAWGYANGTGGAPIWRDSSQFSMPRYAEGMDGAQGTFISGDSEDPMDPAAGGAQPELVQLEDPPGPDNAQARITPLTPPGGPEDGDPKRMGALFHAIGSFLDGGAGMGEFASEMPMDGMPPRYAYGGTIGMNGMSAIMPQDEPYLDRVLEMRKQTPYTLNPFAADYFNSSPTTRSINEAGAQVASGVPVSEFQYEAQRYQPGMLSRDSLNLGR